MKLTYRIITAALSAAMLMSCAVFPTYADSKITYKFFGDEAAKPGYAEGKITLGALPSGKYKLYWADSEKALDGYCEIAELKPGQSFTFAEHTVIPPEAEKLIAVSSATAKVSDAQAVYAIPENKRLKYKSSDCLYKFMNYSDIHIDTSKSRYYDFSELHWQKALETAYSRNADFIVTAGDNITNAEGPGKEFDRFHQILADSPYVNPIYEASGNHELRRGKIKNLLETFITATGLDGNRDTIRKQKPYYLVEEKTTGDIFIFMALEYEYSPDKGDEFSGEQLDWLEKNLKAYYGKNRNIFLIQHALIEGYGAGDDEDNYYTVPLKTKYESTVKFRDIISRYPNLVWISGHTHIALKYGYNYSNMNDTSCHMIHDSSVCCPTMLNYTSHSLSYDAAKNEEYKDLSEGYFVNVYPDEVIFYGENLYHDKIQPAASYILESCRKSADTTTAEPKTEEHHSLPTADDFILFADRCFNLPKSFTYKNIADKDYRQLRKLAEEYLDDMYSFSSYDDYQALKKLMRAKSLEGTLAERYKAICEAYISALPHSREGLSNVYFSNTDKWKQPYAKLSSAKHNNGDQGEPMTKVGKDSDGNDLYKIEVNYHRYSTVEFTDGTEDNKSEPQTLTGDDKLFVLNENDPASPYYCYAKDYKG
jgi:predicted phosphodiesterase